MITIIDYNSGNIGSVCNAMERLGVDFMVTSDVAEIEKAEKVIFPGVGRASAAMVELKKRNLVDVIKNIKVSFLGICLGMQLLLDFSEEDNTNCLGILKGKVKKFVGNNLKVPQIGWNTVSQAKEDVLFTDVKDLSYFYFVNSYYVETEKPLVLGQTEYGTTFASVVKKDNFYGVQFHPEKSGKIGEKLLSNFVKL